MIGRKVQLKKQGREWAGLSPFTNEKTPSFFVNDEKGFLSLLFLLETWRRHLLPSGDGGLSFMEAIEKLAAEAGMELPKSGVSDDEVKKRAGQSEALAAAAAWFQSQLRRVGGREAQDLSAPAGAR